MTTRLIADALLIATGLGVIVLWLIAFDAALFLIRTRRNRPVKFQPGQSVQVVRERTVLSRQGVPRLIRHGDRLIVASHKPDGFLVNCIQGGPAKCELQVPVECVVAVPEGDGGVPAAVGGGVDAAKAAKAA